MNIHILASGSKGNCLYIQSEHANILIDAGISGRRIEGALKNIGASPSFLDAIFLTHEHIDHIAGVKSLVTRYQVPVYATNGTFKKAIDSDLNGEFVHIETDKDIEIKDITVKAFPILHDAVEPVGYTAYDEYNKVGVAMDLGKVTDEVKNALRGSDIFVLEANHDVDMVYACDYPEMLKQRILGDYGHISNDVAGNALAELLRGNGERVYLAHLSDTNNLPTLAQMTVEGILQRRGCQLGQDVVVEIARETKLKE